MNEINDEVQALKAYSMLVVISLLRLTKQLVFHDTEDIKYDYFGVEVYICDDDWLFGTMSTPGPR